MRVSKPENLPRLNSCGSKMAGCETQRLLSYQIACLQGRGRRSYQEDSFAVVNYDDVVSLKNNGLLLVLADGMGGREGGDIASATTVASLRESFAEFDRNDNLAEQLRQAVIKADSQVNRLVGAKGGGSTVVVCLVYKEQLYFASIVDSNIYLMRDGRFTQLNREQDGLQQEYIKTIRGGSMDPKAAREFPDRRKIAQWIGKGFLDDIDFLRRPLELRPGDTLVLCSDGISDYISPDRLCECVKTGTPRDICSRMEDTIIDTADSSQDNYTAIVVRCRY